MARDADPSRASRPTALNIHANLVTVEPVAIALTRDRVAEEAACVADGLVEPVAASFQVVAGPEGFEDLVTLRSIHAGGRGTRSARARGRAGRGLCLAP
jgi:hypothetical protein